jgi:hypothetical protein
VAFEGKYPASVEQRCHAVDRPGRMRLARLARHHRQRAARRRFCARFRRGAARREFHRCAAPRHGGIEPRPRGAGKEPGIRTGLPEIARARFHRSGADTAFRARHRYRAHPVHCVQQVGHDARTERSDGIFFCQRDRRSRRPRRPAFRRHYRSRLAAPKDRRKEWFPSRLPRRSQYRRTLFRALKIWLGAAGGDRPRRTRFSRSGRHHGAGLRP